MKKALLFIIVLCISINFSYSADAGWPFNKTPPIEGVVTDTTTGKPIENVVVSCGWGKTTGTFGGDVYSPVSLEVSVTDKNGRYRIPAKTVWLIFPYWLPMIGSRFEGFGILFFHPLYEIIRGGGGGKNLYIDGQTIEKSPDGIIHCDVQLLGLEEKYSKPEDNFDLSSYILSHDNAAYFINLKQEGIDFDMKEIFGEWERLASRFPEEKHFKQLNRRVKDTEDRIRKRLKELFPEE